MFDSTPFDPASFSGRVRLFPLPNLVLFPHVLQPLHIFEPRYRAMIEEALAGDRLVAMSLLAGGWQGNYEGRPPVHPVACLGRIATHHRLEDGRFNLLLQGVQRVRLLHELPDKMPFREWEAVLCDDVYPSGAATDRLTLQEELVKCFKRALPQLPESIEPLEHLLAADISLGTLTDLVAYVLDLGVDFKQRLLNETNVQQRARWLLEHLDSSLALAPKSAGGNTFPPDFSRN